FLGVAAPALAQSPAPAAPPSNSAAADKGYDGRVEQLITEKGIVKGILLDNGTMVNTPKSQSDDVTEVAALGSTIRAHGLAHKGPRAPVVDATKIQNLDNGAQVTFKQ